MVTLNNEVIPFYLTKLNVIAKENNGHLVLGKPTWADVYFAGILDYLNYLTKTNLLENFPNLQEGQTTLAEFCIPSPPRCSRDEKPMSRLVWHGSIDLLTEIVRILSMFRVL